MTKFCKEDFVFSSGEFKISDNQIRKSKKFKPEDTIPTVKHIDDNVIVWSCLFFFIKSYRTTSPNLIYNKWSHIPISIKQELPYISQSHKNYVQLGVSTG